MGAIHTALAALHQLETLVMCLLGPVFVGLHKSLLLVMRGFGCCLNRAG